MELIGLIGLMCFFGGWFAEGMAAWLCFLGFLLAIPLVIAAGLAGG